jgi:hypothetical protein
MQTKRLTLFPRPVDRDAFHHDYETAYIEAAERLPGLLSWRCTVPLGDDDARPYHVIGELYFADRGALDAALASEAGREFVAAEEALSTGGPPGHSIAVEHNGSPGAGGHHHHE